MSTDSLIGAIIVFVSLGILVGLVVWSRRTINFIADKRLSTAREIKDKISQKDES